MTKRTIKVTKLHLCWWCGQKFVTNNGAAKFCSNKCKQAAYRYRQAQREAEKQWQLPLFESE